MVPIVIKKKWYQRDKNKNSEAKNSKLQLKGRIFMSSMTEAVELQHPGTLQIWWRGVPDVECFTIDFKDEKKVPVWRAVIEQQIKACKEQSERGESLLPDFPWMRDNYDDDVGLPRFVGNTGVSPSQ